MSARPPRAHPPPLGPGRAVPGEGAGPCPALVREGFPEAAPPPFLPEVRARAPGTPGTGAAGPGPGGRRWGQRAPQGERSGAGGQERWPRGRGAARARPCVGPWGAGSAEGPTSGPGKAFELYPGPVPLRPVLPRPRGFLLAPGQGPAPWKVALRSCPCPSFLVGRSLPGPRCPSERMWGIAGAHPPARPARVPGFPARSVFRASLFFMQFFLKNIFY